MLVKLNYTPILISRAIKNTIRLGWLRKYCSISLVDPGVPEMMLALQFNLYSGKKP